MEGNGLALLVSNLKNNIVGGTLGILRQGWLDSHWGRPAEEYTSPGCPLHEDASRFRREIPWETGPVCPNKDQTIPFSSKKMDNLLPIRPSKRWRRGKKLDKQRCNFAIILQGPSIICQFFMLQTYQRIHLFLLFMNIVWQTQPQPPKK